MHEHAPTVARKPRVWLRLEVLTVLSPTPLPCRWEGRTLFWLGGPVARGLVVLVRYRRARRAAEAMVERLRRCGYRSRRRRESRTRRAAT